MPGVDFEIGLKNAKVRAGLAQVRNEVRQFSGSVGGMLTGAFSIAGITAFASKMREVQKDATRFGTTAESIQRVGKAARESDVDFDTLARSINKVTLEAGKAARGGAEQAHTFELLGINAKEFVGMSLDQKILTLSKAFQESRASGMKTSAMLELLGERGSEIIPLLAQGPERLGKTMQDAAVQTNATVAAMANLDRSITKIQAGAGRLLGTAMSYFTKVVGHVSAAVGVNNYDDAAAADLESENMKRRHAGQKEITGSEAEDWKRKRGSEMIRNDVEGAITEGQKSEDEAVHPADDYKKDQGANSAESVANLKKQIAEEEQHNRVEALSGEAKLNELWAQRDALASKINATTAEGLEAKKQDLALEREIGDMKKQQAEKLKEAKAREADVQEKQALEKMSPADKAAYLEKKQKGLYEQANQMQAAPAAAQDKRNEAADAYDKSKRDSDLAAQARGDADAARDRAAKLAQEADSLPLADKMSKGQEANQALAEAKAHDDKATAYQTSADEASARNKRLRGEADKLDKADPVQAVELRIKAEELQPEIDAARKATNPDAPAADEKKKADPAALTPEEEARKRMKAENWKPSMSVSTDSLQRAGGGGRAAGTTVADVARQQANEQKRLLEQIRDELRKQGGGDAPPAPRKPNDPY